MPSDKSSKRVSFSSSEERIPRSSRHERDSGLGSTSTEQAHVGSKSERRFTEQDRQTQRSNHGAVLEALDRANEKNEKYKKKLYDVDSLRLTAISTVREQNGKIAGLQEENASLKQDKAVLQQDNTALREQNEVLRVQGHEYRTTIHELTDRTNALELENDDLRRNVRYYPEPIDPEAMMSGGSGESSEGLRRSRSKRSSRHGSKDFNEHMKERMNRNNPEAQASSSKPSHGSQKKEHRRSASKVRKQPYIEEPPPDRTRPPLTTRFDHYTTTTTLTSPKTSRYDPPQMSPVPRTTNPTVNPYQVTGYATGGDYVPTSIPPEQRPTSRGRKNR